MKRRSSGDKGKKQWRALGLCFINLGEMRKYGNSHLGSNGSSETWSASGRILRLGSISFAV